MGCSWPLQAVLGLFSPSSSPPAESRQAGGDQAQALELELGVPGHALLRPPLAQDPCSLWVFARRETVLFLGGPFPSRDQPSLGSALTASVLFPARLPELKQCKPQGNISWEKLHWARERGLCLCGGWGAWRGSGKALCLVPARGQTLLLRSVAALTAAVAAGSGCCCVRAWCALESKLLSRVFVTQLPAGDRYVPGPDSGGHVPRAPWPFNHVRCLHPVRELARWHRLRLQPSLLPGLLLTLSACCLGRGLGTSGTPFSRLPV